jgi:hypothetical protein
MSYLEFKLTLEMNHIDTFEKDHKVQKMYKNYLKEFNEERNRNRREQRTK